MLIAKVYDNIAAEELKGENVIWREMDHMF
jgi:hypothetical protein